LPAAALALHAQIHTEGVDGKRTVPAEEFYLGIMTTAIQPDEIVTSVEIPLRGGEVFGFSEFARRPGDFALAGAFIEIQENGQGAVTWFGVSDRPERRELELKHDESERVEAFKQLAQELEPLDEPEYRRHLAVLAAEQAYQDAKGGQK
jgi:carbon-monoxide dehydrogenase medium subunit